MLSCRGTRCCYCQVPSAPALRLSTSRLARLRFRSAVIWGRASRALRGGAPALECCMSAMARVWVGCRLALAARKRAEWREGMRGRWRLHQSACKQQLQAHNGWSCGVVMVSNEE